ncbi:MAG TPA: phosphatase [Bacteroidetes bacterium]|nr:phosphatase [Bacteroidota bacterium]
MRIATIDCGTNTFHLLVVDAAPDGSISRVHKERRYVRIGQEGLDKIGEAPFRRGIACLSDYKSRLAQFGVERVKVFGTEALRRATNGQAFLAEVKKETGICIELISGEEEARLIHLGVMQAVPPIRGKALIMDIGGGSVEFIVAGARAVFWAKSFPIGVQVLFSKFHQKDPLPQEQLKAMRQYLDEQLQPLSDVLIKHKTPVLIGASGSFEVVESMHEKPHPHPLHSIVPVEDYFKIHQKIIGSSLAGRYQMEGLPPERAELIVVAFVLIEYVLKKAGIRRIVTSAYALKEGVLYEMIKTMTPQ